MLQLAETMSNDKPENGWFIPNCDEEKGTVFLDEANTAKRQLTRVPLFSTGQDKNVLQVRIYLMMIRKRWMKMFWNSF